MANSQKNEKFISKNFGSKKEFANDYRQTYAEVDKAKELYLFALRSLKKAVEENDVSRLQKYGTILESIHEVEKETNLSEFNQDSSNVFKNTNLIILASLLEKEDSLEYLFDNKSALLKCLSEVKPCTPSTQDEFGHNAFYYAIRSGNVKLLKLLIKRWPNNYFKDNAGELDEIISTAYEELKLKNVALSDEMEIFVGKTILNIRFFSNNETVNNKCIKNDSCVSRVQMVIENINTLRNEYQTKSIDSTFIFKLTFIAQNVHILKQQLKFTYDKIPWEEIEFILISFISSLLKKQEINLFYKAILNKDKVLIYLKRFAEFLQWEKDSIQCGYNNNSNVLKLKRQNVVKAIIERHPDMKDLYDDFQQIRDVHSLEKISGYIKLALSSDPKKKEGQLIIIRVIQVIGEYLKNTLESPNLSEKTSDIFLRSMQKNMREIIVDLRNSLSHAYSLSKRTELEQIIDTNFFKGVQNDVRSIDNEISDILYKYRFELAKKLLKKTRETTDIEEFAEIAEIAKNITIDNETRDCVSKNEHKKLQTLLKEFSEDMSAKKIYNPSIIDKIKSIVNKVENKCASTKKNYIKALKGLQDVGCVIRDGINKNMFTPETTRSIYYLCEEALSSFKEKADQQHVSELVREVRNLFEIQRLDSDSLNSHLVRELVNYLIILIEINSSGDISCIEELRESLCNKDSFVAGFLKKKYCDEGTDYSDQLSSKLNELRTIIKNNSLGYSIEKLKLYKDDKKLQAVIEMLVLDIMSILSSSKHNLENNLFFLDDNSPLLTGKCLRNHLAHDNILFDVLLFDPSMSIILNARKLAEENIQDSTKKIGKPISFNYLKLKEKYEQGLVVIRFQCDLFKAAEEGNLQDFENCLRAGADIYAKDQNSWTTLHFAAKGPSLEIVKLILSHNIKADVVNSRNESPLHIAATHGRTHIVEYLIKEQNLKVDTPARKNLTPLHLAAQNGHVETVKLLLSLGASKFLKDKYAYSPLLKAVTHKRPEVVKILLEGETNIDADQSAGGFTALCQAGETGCLESAILLLQKGASVKKGSDFKRTPLHGAAFGGYFDVAKLLIDHGAEVDAKVLDGATPLFYAVENGSNDVVELLIQHHANVNHQDKIYHATPIIVAAKDGNTQLVETLLKNKADPNIVNIQGRSALHFAAEFGHTEAARVLIKNGARINTKDNNGDTPLQYASYTKHPKIVELLIKNDADLGITAFAKATPLHTAAANNTKEIIELLVKKGGFDIDTEDHEGRSALLVASASADADVVELLIKNHANVNKKSKLCPLHAAAASGRIKNIKVLLSNGASLNAQDFEKATALHHAARNGHANIVELLISRGAVIDQKDNHGKTALHQAVEVGHIEAVKVLVAKGASVKTSVGSKSLLIKAMKHKVEMMELLISSGAEIDKPKLIDGGPFMMAVLIGNKKVVEIFLKRKEALANAYTESKTPILHLAAQLDHAEIVKLLIAYGANIHAVGRDQDNHTALDIAVTKNAENAVQVLIDNGARVNGHIHAENIVQRLTPLHVAVLSGYYNIVKMLLNCNKTNVNAKDSTNRTPLVWAVECNKVAIAKEFYRLGKFKATDKFGPDNDWTLLHVCADKDEIDNIDIAKYLVNEVGVDINARSVTNAKAIHVAARAGQKNIVKFLVEKGLSVDEPAMNGQSPLFYAAIKGRIKVAEYLLSKGADVNLKDRLGSRVINLAAAMGYADLVSLLLQYGAINSHFDNLIMNTEAGGIRNIRSTTKPVSDVVNKADRLFDAVKQNNASSVRQCIKDGAIVNAKNSSNSTPLHFACWKGYTEIVEILVGTSKCDLNPVGDKGYFPLHYAAKFGHYEIVKILLSNGAIYDAASESGKTPLDFSTDKKITQLLALLSKSFKNIEENNARFIDDLKKINDKSLKRSILRARNSEKETLIVVAERRKFSKLDQLKELIYGETKLETSELDSMLVKGKHEDALKILKEIFDSRKELLGSDNPGTLEVLHQVAKTYYAQGNFMEAKKSYENVYNKRKEILGPNHADTLRARSDLGLVYHRLGKNEESIRISREVLEKQKSVLGPEHMDTMGTYFNLGIALQSEPGKTEEALKVYEDCLEHHVNNAYDSRIANVMNNIGMCQSALGRYDEAARTLELVYDLKKKLFGPESAVTIRTVINIAGVYVNQNNIPKAVEWYKKGLALQKRILGLKHPETLMNQFNFGNIMMKEGKILSAYKAYHEILNPMIEVYGPSNDMVTSIKMYMEALDKNFAPQGKSCGEIVADLHQELNRAIECGDYQMVKQLLDGGAELGVVDGEGRSPLHFAASKGHTDIVKLLIDFNAEVTLVTKKGNTALHMACLVGNEEIVNLLIKHVVSGKLRGFVNAKTIAGNTTALHVAAKKGSFNIVKTLLKNGAIFEARNKDRSTPAKLCTEERCVQLLELISSLFENLKKEDKNFIEKMKNINANDFLVIANARDADEKTLLQVAMVNKRKNVAEYISERLKECIT